MNKHKVSRIVIAALLITAVLSMGTFGLAGAKEKPPVHPIPCTDEEFFDSSDEIEEALVTAVEDEVIQLEACTYYISRVIDVRTAFHGTLRGAGKDLTVIEILPDHKIPAVETWPDYYESHLFLFMVPAGQKADITMTDLSMLVTDPEPAVGQTEDPWVVNSLGSYIAVYGNEADTAFERLRLTGSYGFSSDQNVFVAVVVREDTELMRGNQTFSDVDISHAVIGYDPVNLRDGKIKITGNTFTDIAWRAINAWDFDNCQVEITSNEINSPWIWGIGIFQIFYPPEKPSSFLVARNHIVVGPDEIGIIFVQGAKDPTMPIVPAYLTITQNDIHTTGDGIIVVDDDYSFNGTETLNAVISENNIFLDNASWGAIELIGGQGARITDNHIYCKGMTGINMGIFPEYGERV